MSTWRKVEVAHPIFRTMRSDRRSHRRREWPYIEIDRIPYRVRRVVSDTVAWVTPVTNPVERFTVAMRPTETPFMTMMHRRNPETTKQEWSMYGDTKREMAGRKQRPVPHDL